MKPEIEALVVKQRSLLEFRDLSDGTISTYINYLRQFLNWVDSELPGKNPEDVTWEEMRSYINYLRNIRRIGNRTVNVHIAQLHHFWHYVLKKTGIPMRSPFFVTTPRFRECRPFRR